MKIYITKQVNGKYHLLMNWQNPETGAMMGQWFENMKDLKEYIREWVADIEEVN